MEKISNEHFKSYAALWNTSSYPIILSNMAKGNGSEYHMPLESIVKLSIICVGTPANLVVILASARLFTQSQRSHNILILLLAIADILYLLSITGVQKGIFGTIGFGGSLLYCSILNTIIIFSGLMSSWLVASICCERFICVKWPIKMHLNRNKYKKWSAFVLIVMFVILAGISSLQFMFSHVEDGDNLTQCFDAGTDDKHGITIEIFTVSLYGVIPTIPVLFFNISILRIMVKHNKNKEHRPDGNKGNNGLRTSKKKTSVTVTVLSVSLMFVIGRSPYSILHIVDLIVRLFTGSYLFLHRRRVYLIFHVIDLLDHTWNLGVYICSSSIFRSQLYNMIKCSK